MTKLEEEILLEIDPLLKDLGPYGIKAVEADPDNDILKMAKAAAEVAKRYIENAVIDIMKEDYAMGGQVLNEETMRDLLDVWLKENGVI